MPVERQKSLGLMLHKLRADRGLTQTELAEKVGTSNTHISKWEADTNAPSDKYLQKLATALEVPVDLLHRRKQRDEMERSGIITEPMTSYSKSKAEIIKDLEVSMHLIKKAIEQLKEQEDL